MHHALLYISLPSLYDYNVKVPNDFLLFLRTSMQSFKIQHQKSLPTFDELNEME